jgi:hypothetical protein
MQILFLLHSENSLIMESAKHLVKLGIMIMFSEVIPIYLCTNRSLFSD